MRGDRGRDRKRGVANEKCTAVDRRTESGSHKGHAHEAAVGRACRRGHRLLVVATVTPARHRHVAGSGHAHFYACIGGASVRPESQGSGTMRQVPVFWGMADGYTILVTWPEFRGGWHVQDT